jgi:hypothetical protein
MSIEITNESRDYAKFWKEVSNFTSETLYFDNVDGRNFFIKMLVIPQFRVYGTNKNISNWNPTLYIYKDSQEISVDTTPCWGWWDNTSSEWEVRQYEDCPTVSFEMKGNDDNMTLTIQTENRTGKPSGQFLLYYYGYTTAFAGDFVTYSDTKRIASNSLSEFFSINLNIWKGFYYLLVVIVVVLGVLFIIGAIPLLIKKIIVKVSGTR